MQGIQRVMSSNSFNNNNNNANNSGANSVDPAGSEERKKALPKISSIIAFPPLPTTSGQTCGRKRDREGHTSDSSVAPTEVMSERFDSDVTSVSMVPASESRPKKKRGRPPTTGQYVGLYAAKRQLEELERQEMERRAEKELEEKRASRKADRERIGGTGSGDKEIRPQGKGEGDPIDAGLTPADVLLRRVEEDVEAIKRVASSSKNLKGIYVKALKEAFASILEENMTSRTTSREVRILQQENDRLRIELQIIRNELSAIRKEITAGKEAKGTQPPTVQETVPPTRAEERPSKATREPPHRQRGGRGRAPVAIRRGANHEEHRRHDGREVRRDCRQAGAGAIVPPADGLRRDQPGECSCPARPGDGKEGRQGKPLQTTRPLSQRRSMTRCPSRRRRALTARPDPPRNGRR